MKKQKSRSLTALADAAFLEAAQEVIKRAEEFGTPVIVWNGDSIEAVNPRDIASPRISKNRRRGKSPR